MCIEFSEAEIGEAILGSDGNTLGPPSGDDGLLELVDQLLAREVAMWVFVYTITDIYEASEITDPVLTVVRTHLAEPVLSREQRIELRLGVRRVRARCEASYQRRSAKHARRIELGRAAD